MKIAFISYEDSNDISAWSGTIHSMAKYLAIDNELIRIDNLSRPIDYLFKFMSFVLWILGKSSDYKRNVIYVKLVCKRIQKILDKLDYDVIFAPGSTYITFLKSDKPIVIWADATFKSLMESYPQYSNLPKSQINDGNKLESIAFHNSTKLIFSTSWAAQSAQFDYNVKDTKIEIIPFGANLTHNNSETDILEFNKIKDSKSIKLLFIGVDWVKKGGNLLLNIFSELKLLSGIYTLDVVGSAPKKIPVIEGVTFHGFLNKSDKSQNEKLISLFKSSHYFLLPTKAEAFGIVFCEANSYGLPTFGSNLGGIVDIIKNGVNGELIDIKKSPKDLAIQIHNYISNGDYNEKSLSAFNHYQNNFTWMRSIEKVNNVLKQLV